MNRIRKSIMAFLVASIGLLPSTAALAVNIKLEVAASSYEESMDKFGEVMRDAADLIFKPKEQSMVPGIVAAFAAMWYWNKLKASGRKVLHFAKNALSVSALIYLIVGIAKTSQGEDLGEYLKNSWDVIEKIFEWSKDHWQPLALAAGVIPLIDTGSSAIDAVRSLCCR